MVNRFCFNQDRLSPLKLSANIKNDAPAQYKQLLRKSSKFKQFRDLNIVWREKNNCVNQRPNALFRQISFRKALKFDFASEIQQNFNTQFRDTGKLIM